MSAGHVGGRCGSGIVSSAAHVLWMSVVRGMGGVGGDVRCVCVWFVSGGGGVGGEGDKWMRGLGLGFTNPVGTGSVGRVSVFRLRWCGYGLGGGGVVLCLC